MQYLDQYQPLAQIAIGLAGFGYFAAYVESACLLAPIWFLFIASFNFVLLLLDPEGDGDYSN